MAEIIMTANEDYMEDGKFYYIFTNTNGANAIIERDVIEDGITAPLLARIEALENATPSGGAQCYYKAIGNGTTTYDLYHNIGHTNYMVQIYDSSTGMVLDDNIVLHPDKVFFQFGFDTPQYGDYVAVITISTGELE